MTEAAAVYEVDTAPEPDTPVSRMRECIQRTAQLNHRLEELRAQRRQYLDWIGYWQVVYPAYLRSHSDLAVQGKEIPPDPRAPQISRENLETMLKQIDTDEKAARDDIADLVRQADRAQSDWIDEKLESVRAQHDAHAKLVRADHVQLRALEQLKSALNPHNTTLDLRIPGASRYATVAGDHLHKMYGKRSALTDDYVFFASDAAIVREAEEEMRNLRAEFNMLAHR